MARPGLTGGLPQSAGVADARADVLAEESLAEGEAAGMSEARETSLFVVTSGAGATV